MTSRETIKLKVDNAIKEKQQMFNLFLSDVIKNVYEQFVQNENTCNKDSSIDINNLLLEKYNTLSCHNCVNCYYVSYQMLQQIYPTHMHIYNKLDIKKVFSSFTSADLSPYIIITIDFNYLNVYKDDYDTFNTLFYQFIQPIEFKDNIKFKLLKYKCDKKYYLVMFFDCLTYNSEYLFDYNNYTTDVIDYTEVSSIDNTLIHQKQKQKLVDSLYENKHETNYKDIINYLLSEFIVTVTEELKLSTENNEILLKTTYENYKIETRNKIIFNYKITVFLSYIILGLVILIVLLLNLLLHKKQV
jgi:hypothetical protein